MSQINVTTIRNRTGGPPSLDQGVVVGSAATFSSTVSIAGTLTYEDVTNIDSVGIITAQSYVSIADSIVHTGDINTSLRFPAADTFTVETGGSERIRVDSSGRLAIGNNTPQSFTGNSSDNLVVGSGSGGEGITIYSATDNQGALSFADGTSGDAQYRGALSYNHTADRMDFRVNGTTIAAAIDSAGKFGIGTQSPGTELHVNGTTPIFRLSNGSTNIFEVKADTTTTAIRNTTNTALEFSTNDTARLTISNGGAATFTGDVIAGGDPNSAANIGAKIQNEGIVQVCRAGTDTLFVGSLHNSGATSTINAAGAATFSGLLTLDDTGANAGIQLGTGADFTVKRVAPAVKFNAGADLDHYEFCIGGTEKISFNADGGLTCAGGATFSSGLYLGGTGTANHLDDYEEGSWTPALSSDWTSVTYTIQRGRYIKIGNLVYIYYTLQMSAATSPGSAYAFSILNLPFQGYDYLAGYFGGGVSGSNIDSFVTDNWTTVFYGGAGTSFTFNDQGGNTSLRCGSNITSTAHGYISGWLVYSADTFI